LNYAIDLLAPLLVLGVVLTSGYRAAFLVAVGLVVAFGCAALSQSGTRRLGQAPSVQ
jgi:hypothetical protein